MAKYYYEKWSVKTQYSNVLSNSYEVGNETWEGNTSRTFNTQTGVYTLSGSYVYNSRSNIVSAAVYFLLPEGKLGEYFWLNDKLLYRQYEASPNVVKDAYIETIVAEDGTYPDNGKSGSYWYVKTDKVFPNMQVNINGTWKTADSGWVNINGTWREITSIKVNIGGTWRES